MLNWAWARSAIYNIFAVAFLIIGAYLLLTDREWAAAGRGGTAILAGFVCAFFANLDQFKNFEASATGIKATIREAKEVVSEAKEAIEGLRHLGAATGMQLVRIIAMTGRWASQSPVEKDAQKASLLASLNDLGIDKETLQEIDTEDRPWVIVDYVQGIFVSWIRTPGVSAADNATKWRELVESWKTRSRPSPDQVEKIMDEWGINDAMQRELLADYRHYFITGTHRRPAVWASREEWLL